LRERSVVADKQPFIVRRRHSAGDVAKGSKSFAENRAPVREKTRMRSDQDAAESDKVTNPHHFQRGCAAARGR
jgi:hypothetical protein